MRGELVQFSEEYADRVTVASINISTNWGGQGDLPVMAIPTQFFFNADGSPVRPTWFALDPGFDLLPEDDGEGHVLTRHTGFMSYDDLADFFDDVLSQH